MGPSIKTRRKPRGRRLALAAGAALALAQGAQAQTARLDPAALPALGVVDERFQSYNVEMAELIGGRFWRPYDRMGQAGAEAETSAGDAVALRADLFMAREPADLSNQRVRALARALGPAYVRVSGSWANSVYFQDDDEAPLAAPPEGYRGVLTRAQWRGLIEFVEAVDARLTMSFAINAPVRDAEGVWTPAQAGPLVAYTHALGGEIHAAELFNEPNLSAHAGGPPDYNGAAFARDIAAFRAFAAEAAPRMKIVGPGDVSTGNLAVPGAVTTEQLLTGAPRPRFDIYSYHYYPAVSQRCAPGAHPIGTTADKALSEAFLSGADVAIQARRPLRDQYAPGAPIWLGETAQAACGGSPWAATFLDSFRYLDQAGRLARQDVDVIFHNTLAAGEYALIDEFSHEPRPNYWAALLWRRLMGTTVLDAGAQRDGLKLYAHCLRDTPGGVSLLALNMTDESAIIEAPGRAELYILTAPELQSKSVQLNGRTLKMRGETGLPSLRPRRSRAGEAALPAHSIGFIALPGANNPNCG